MSCRKFGGLSWTSAGSIYTCLFREKNLVDTESAELRLAGQSSCIILTFLLRIRSTAPKPPFLSKLPSCPSISCGKVRLIYLDEDYQLSISFPITSSQGNVLILSRLVTSHWHRGCSGTVNIWTAQCSGLAMASARSKMCESEEHRVFPHEEDRA